MAERKSEERKSEARKFDDRKSRESGPPPWHVPVAVEKIAETGQHFDLAADAGVRAAVAKLAGLRDLPRFEAKFDLERLGMDGLHVTGHVSATAGQNCVVTLEPLDNHVEETVDLVFEPRDPVAETDKGAAPAPRAAKLRDREPLVGGMVDLGALATEFLILGLDPYPRKPGAVFEPLPDGKPEEGPFAALSTLTKGQGRDGH
jgi:hypothetical protein